MFEIGEWQVIEPVMLVEVTSPIEYQGAVLAGLNKRHAIITGQDSTENFFTITCEVSLIMYNCVDPVLGHISQLSVTSYSCGKYPMVNNHQ